jgi:hypothetical protein
MSISEILQRVEAVNECASDIRGLAREFEHLDNGTLETAIEEAMACGAQQAVGRLLLCAGHLGRRLDLGLLARSVDACKEVNRAGLAFFAWGEAAVEPLLALADSCKQLLDRRIYALFLAGRLATNHGLDLRPIKRLHEKLTYSEEAKYVPNSAELLGVVGLILAEEEALDLAGAPSVPFEHRLEDILPEHAHRKVVAKGAPVRRPVVKLGRNEPCHCGSGKKYKKCCFDKDQKLRSDASEFEGITRSSLIENPGQVDDYHLIYQMRLYELERIDPAKLSFHQLHAAATRARRFHAWELSLKMMSEAERRSDKPFTAGHFDDLLWEALNRNSLAFAQKLREEMRRREGYDPEWHELDFHVLEEPATYRLLDEYCRMSVKKSAEDKTATPLQDLFFAIIKSYPALGIILGRAVLIGGQEYIDEELILERIRIARVALEVEPTGDVAESLIDWIEDRENLRAREQKESEEAKRVREQLRTMRKALDRKRGELEDQERELSRLGRELAEAEKARQEQGEEATPANPVEHSKPNQEREEMLARLRNQVNNLKAEIGEQQQERRRLRAQLAEERKRHDAATSQEGGEPAHPPEPEEVVESPRPMGKILVPEYANAFTKHCGGLPPQVAADALQAIGNFAAHEVGIWRKTKPLERLRDHYRMRIGIDYRLLFYWKAGEVLKVLDIIPRGELEAWIKRHG